jgi:hypothetical protein
MNFMLNLAYEKSTMTVCKMNPFTLLQSLRPTSDRKKVLGLRWTKGAWIEAAVVMVFFYSPFEQIVKKLNFIV